MKRIPLKEQTMKHLSSVIDSEFKKEVMKVLKELRKAIDRNADYCKKELETIKRK